MQGRLVFDGTLLRDVVRELDRTFDVHITIADSVLAADPVTGSFDTETVDQVLNAITTVIGGRYERAGRAIVIRRGASRADRARSGIHVPSSTAT
jgi:ferric-dicitrate binding protein FerR (iron transport regulator)